MTDGPSGEMPFLDHLEELRKRLFWALGSLFVAMMIAFAVILRPQFDIIGYFASPILPMLPSGKLIFTNPVDPFTIRLKIAFGFGLVLAAPVIFYQVWAFLSPALHKHEKRLVVPVIGFATLLFATGVWAGWRYALPVMLGVLFSFQAASMQAMISATEYFSFMVTLCLAFGGVMQLPVVIMAMTALGLVTPKALMKFRRHAMAGSVVASAIITPGDVLTVTVVMALPLYALYELSIIVSWFTHRARERRLRRAEAASSIGGSGT
jgi:sec-independent protein translocase protein TatC